MPWKEIWGSYKGRITGITAGIFFGFIYLWAGFWNMLFFALMVFIGYTLGRRSDSELGSLLPWKEWGDWVSQRWRPFK